MTVFRLPRGDGPDLEFEGELLSEADSREHKKHTRWSEVRIYRTTDGRYVTEQVRRGGGDVADISTVHLVPAEAVVDSLRLPERGLVATAISALKAAAARDAGLYEHAVEHL